MTHDNPTPSVTRPSARRGIGIQHLTLSNLRTLFLEGEYKEATELVEDAVKRGIFNIAADRLYAASLHLVIPADCVPEARHAPAVCPGPGYLFQYGGVSVSSGRRLFDLWRYEFTQNHWLLLDDVSREDSIGSVEFDVANLQYPAIAYFDNSVFMVGATEERTHFFRFDIVSKKWSSIRCDINPGAPCPFLRFQIQVDEANGIIYILGEAAPVYADQSRLFRFSVSDSNWECVLNLQEHPNLASVGRTMVWSALTKCLYFLDGYRVTDDYNFIHSSASFRFSPDERTLQGIKARNDGSDHPILEHASCFQGAFAPDSRSIWAIGDCETAKFPDLPEEFMSMFDITNNRWEYVSISGRNLETRSSQGYEQLVYAEKSQRVFLVGAGLWELKLESHLEDVIQRLTGVIKEAESRERSNMDTSTDQEGAMSRMQNIIDARLKLFNEFHEMFPVTMGREQRTEGH